MIRNKKKRIAFFKEIFTHGATEEQAITMCGVIRRPGELRTIMRFMKENPDATVREIAMKHREFLGYDR